MEKLSHGNEFRYRLPPNQNQITGLDLEIDKHTLKLCETYNKSSGATRSVLYILLLLCVISLIAVFNSNWEYNWTAERANKVMDDILKKEDTLRQKTPDTTKIKDKMAALKKEEEILIQADIDNNYTIRFSVLGLAIDIFDLSSISGLSLIILLIVLRFTLIREGNNLRIALNSVNERYPSDADYDKFKIILNAQNCKPIINADEDWDKLISDINFVRRRYHYNFLSMNDIFNMPFMDISENRLQSTITGRVINKYLFYFFLLVYSYIILNAFCSMDKARALNNNHMYVILGFSMVFYLLVFNICRRCVEQRKIIYKALKRFWEQDYLYDHNRHEPKDMSIALKLVIPLFLLSALYVLSLFFCIHGHK